LAAVKVDMKVINRWKAWIDSVSNLNKVKSMCLEWVRPDQKILEIGPGDGETLRALVQENERRGLNLEIHALDYLEILLSNLPPSIQCHLFDLNVLKDTRAGLSELPFATHSFDLLILS